MSYESNSGKNRDDRYLQYNYKKKESNEDESEMKRRERLRRPSDRQAASISTKRALLLLAICLLCLMCTKMLAGW